METSFFSACVTTRADVDSQSWKGRSLAWLATQAKFHQLFVSDEVLAELSAPSYPLSHVAIRFTSGMEVLTVSEEILVFGQHLIDEKVMPGPNEGDAVHVATAVLAQMDYLLTWNVKHLANVNKRVHLSRVCQRIGKVAPLIVTPDLLWEIEGE